MSTTSIPEMGNPKDDSRAFRRSLGEFATGVTVITAQHDGQRVGMVVNSFSAVSLEPPMVLWSLRRESKNVALFSAAGHFAVNVLSASQMDVSQQFASGSGDRFASVPWTPGQSGAPLLDGAVASFECRFVTCYEGGDHLIMLGQVEQYVRRGGDPLLFAQGRYCVAQEHPGLAGAEAVRVAAPDGLAGAAQEKFMRLLFRAGHVVSTRFDEERSAEGLTLPQARVLAWLYDRPASMEVLKQTIYLGERDVEDAVTDLKQAGYVSQLADGRIEVTQKGRSRREGIDTRVARFEQKLFDGIPPAQIDTLRKVLLEITARAERL